jgi:uncharacterized protein (TIGR04255 family)
MITGPDIPAATHERLENPPLKAMLGQVRFPSILKVADLAAVAPFQEAVRDDFPEFAQEQQVSVVIGPEGPQQPVAGRSYRFATSDGTWSVVLAPDSMTVEAGPGQYTSYQAFRQRFASVWEAVVTQFGPTRIIYQGLRYIDHIEREFEGPEWAKLINRELLGGLAGEHLSGGLLHSVTDMRFQRPDGLLFFKHGITRAGPENSIGYLLDFDYFTQEPTEDLEVESLMQRFDTFHELLYAFFRWCVTDEAIQEFRRAGV